MRSCKWEAVSIGNYYHTIKNAKIDIDNLTINSNVQKIILDDMRSCKWEAVSNSLSHSYMVAICAAEQIKFCTDRLLFS